MLEKIPAYELLKTKAQSALSFEETEGMTPVAARFDDSWQLAFEIERIDGGKVVLCFPGLPIPGPGRYVS